MKKIRNSQKLLPRAVVGAPLLAASEHPRRMKPSQFLTECIHSHSIYEVGTVTADFERETGITINPAIGGRKLTKKDAKAMRDSGGHCDPAAIGKEMIAGYSFALILCSRFNVEYESSLGRGSQFRNCITALHEAGK